jgi:hypothetical protein
MRLVPTACCGRATSPGSMAAWDCTDTEIPGTQGGYEGKHTYAESLNFVRYCEALTDDEKEQILGGTVRRLLGWPGGEHESVSPAGQTIRTVAGAERLAKRRLPKVMYESIAYGAGQELTLRWNVDAFNEVQFRPQAAIRYPSYDLGTTVLGTRNLDSGHDRPDRKHQNVSAGGRTGRSRGRR